MMLLGQSYLANKNGEIISHWLLAKKNHSLFNLICLVSASCGFDYYKLVFGNILHSRSTTTIVCFFRWPIYTVDTILNQ